MSVRPETFDEIVGQEQAKTVCKTLIKASKKTGEIIPSILFSAASGAGKSTFAYVFAKEAGLNLHNVNAASVKTQKDLIDIFNKVRPGDCVFIDEVHALNNKVSQSIYTILEDFRYFVNGSEKRVNKFTCLAATNLLGNMQEALKNRFSFVAELTPYSQEELVDVCMLVCKKKGFKLNRDIAELIANTCKGTPRTIAMRTSWIYSYLKANNLSSVSADELIKIIALQGVDRNGLDINDRKYLQAIMYDTVGLSELANKLNLDKLTVANTIEPYLMEKGYVRITKSGREITHRGMEVLEKS